MMAALGKEKHSKVERPGESEEGKGVTSSA